MLTDVRFLVLIRMCSKNRKTGTPSNKGFCFQTKGSERLKKTISLKCVRLEVLKSP